MFVLVNTAPWDDMFWLFALFFFWRLQFETADDEDFVWVQENIDGIVLQLQKLTGQPGEEVRLSKNTV